MQLSGHPQAEFGVLAAQPGVGGAQIAEIPLQRARPAGLGGAAQPAFGLRDQVRGPPCVPRPGLAQPPALGEPFQAVAAQRLQQPVPGRAPVQLGGDQGAVGEVQQEAGHPGRVAWPAGDRAGGSGVEAAVEHRQPAEQVLLPGGELLVGPVHHRAQRTMAATGPASDGQQPEPVPQVPGQLADRGPGQPRGGQLDGQRQAVQAGTQPGDRGDVRVLPRRGRVSRAGPVQEQPDGRSARAARPGAA